MPSNRRFLLVPAIVLGLAVAGPGALSQTPDNGSDKTAPELSRKLGAFVYIEEGQDLIFTVGVRASAFHEGDAYFPLEISLTNKQKGTAWVVTRESFTLFDEAGTEYEVPTQAELMEGYKKRHADTRLFESRSVTATKLEGYRQMESNFFPDPVIGINRQTDTYDDMTGVPPASASLIPIERVEVHSMFFIQDVLYFPHPEGKLIGPRFSLEFRAEGLEEPARISFSHSEDLTGSRVILVLDNYDSFTYNLVQYLAELGWEVRVERNDALTVAQALALRPAAVLISPGPGRPEAAGISIELTRAVAGRLPLLGVCLGHQALGAAFGTRITSARSIMHGKTSQVRHDGRTVYAGLPNPLEATRYHSLVLDRASLPSCLEVSAWTSNGTIMGVRHVELALEGVQFHPESILTRDGKVLLSNFLARCA